MAATTKLQSMYIATYITVVHVYIYIYIYMYLQIFPNKN